MHRISSTASRIRIALLAVAGLLAALLLAVGTGQGRRLPVAARATTPDVTGPVATTTGAPATTATPLATPGASPSPPYGQIFTVLPTKARFTVPVHQGWRIGFADNWPKHELRFITRIELGPTWDPMPAAWIDVRATREPLVDVREEIVAAGWTAEPSLVDLDGHEALILGAPYEAGRDPIALVRAFGITYQITAHDIDGPRRASGMLRAFLGHVVPLGVAA